MDGSADATDGVAGSPVPMPKATNAPDPADNLANPAVAAEGEHGQGDERFGGVEPERDAGQQPDLGVGGFDQSVGQAVVEGGVDGCRGVCTMRPASSTKTGMRQRRAQEIHRSRACLPASPLTENTCRRPSLSR